MESGLLTRWTPELDLVASVTLRLDNVQSVGGTPDGVHMQFMLHGTINGPKLRGSFPPSTTAFLRIDADGVGTINVRAPLKLDDGALIELEAAGRYDFGPDGYAGALKGALPASDLGWCPRLLTSDERYLWLNRTQLLGVGRLVPDEKRVDYDLYALRPGAPAEREMGTPSKPAAYEPWVRGAGVR